MKRFLNRETAGKEIAEKLAIYKDKSCVVLAIPRGGVPLGFEISKTLECPLGLVWVKKIGHPLSPELAIGAVSPDDMFIDYNSIASDLYLHSEIEKIRARFNEMKKTLGDPTGNTDLKNKIIILVDDGIATGHTISAAIRLLRKKLPAKIIIAVPVAPGDAVKKIKTIADEVIVLYIPEFFTGISGFYTDFTQLSDEDVAKYINASMNKKIIT
jgi:putative phosphoribosyl transferase